MSALITERPRGAFFDFRARNVMVGPGLFNEKEAREMATLALAQVNMRTQRTFFCDNLKTNDTAKGEFVFSFAERFPIITVAAPLK